MMKKTSRESSSLKYSVLKPNPLIAALKGRFQPHENDCGFQLAEQGEVAVRQYTLTLESLEKFLQSCQWRLSQGGPIVSCLYLDLLSPRAASCRLTVQVYVQHIELPLARMEGLISPEAIYLIKHAIKGFKLLWERSGGVGLRDDAIGLNSQGQCRVWLNSSLALDYPHDPPCIKPWDIGKNVIRMVQERTQAASHALLGRLLQKIGSRELDFNAFERILTIFIKNCHINIPENLKYLVDQDRLRKKILMISTRINQMEEPRLLKTPSFIPRKNALFDWKELPPNAPQFSARKMPQRHMSAMHTTITPIKHHTSIYSSARPDSHDQSIVEASHKLRLSNAKRVPSSYASKQSPSRHYSQSFESIGLLGSLTPKHCNRNAQDFSIQEAKRPKRESAYSQNTRTKVSIMSKLSNSSLYDLATTKNLLSKCSYVDNQSQQLADLNSESESESAEPTEAIIEEPTTPKLPMRAPIDNSEPTFHYIPAAEQIILANKWTTTLRNLTEHDAKLNTSIVEGQDTSVYLADVRLDRLEGLSKELAVSVSSRGSENL